MRLTLAKLLLILCPSFALAQNTYLPQGAKENILLERMEIMTQVDSVLNFSKLRPFGRRDVTIRASRLDSTIQLSKTDQYNLRSLKLNNLEWAIGDRNEFQSRKPVWKDFYRTPANLYEINSKDLFLAVNPVIQFQFSKESGNDQTLFLNTRGLTIRGRIANKIGFAAYVTDNQERDPLYVQRWVNERQAIPGQGYWKEFKTSGYDYFDGRGYFTFNVTKYIDVAFGYDKNFIGNGYRSLFLSDFSSPALFLKLNTRIWKFNYQNLFMEIESAYRRGADQLLPKKYAALHHLDLNVTKWLNVGLFEGIIFGRKDHFEFGYLNPVIFYRSIERQNGSFDNGVAGLDAKVNAAKKFQFYGQLLLDEFKLSELRAGNGWWGNKYSYQLGAKYIDAFKIRNLDLQLELNRVRPFTYSHDDSVANYTNYNQPLAHPLGANFNEVIGIVRYQPAPKWMIQGKLIFYKQGLDKNGESFGANIFLPNVPPYRLKDYGFDVGSGQPLKGFYGSLLLSYELRENLFLDLSGVHRNYDVTGNTILTDKTTIISFGVRLNMNRREFDF